MAHFFQNGFFGGEGFGQQKDPEEVDNEKLYEVLGVDKKAT